MKLQALKHSTDDIPNETQTILVHIVDEVTLGGEFTVCGRAIPQSNIDIDGWQSEGQEYIGTIRKVTCPNCLRILTYYKHLR